MVLFEYKTLFSFFVKMVERDRSCLEKNKNCIYAKAKNMEWLYTSRCTARKVETYLRYTFFVGAKFV